MMIPSSYQKEIEDLRKFLAWQKDRKLIRKVAEGFGFAAESWSTKEKTEPNPRMTSR